LSSATIRDVANRAGVSIKTVSRVINKEPFVKSSTQEKVLTAIDELGYVASMSARRLASGQSYTIGLIFHNASWHYTQDVLKGVIETARKSGYSTLLHPCDVCNDLDAKEVLNLVHQKAVDGLIFTPPADNAKEVIRELQQLEVPFVRLTPQDRKSPLPYVTATDMQGAFEMTNYLIGLGHRRIGFVLGPLDQRAGHDRFAGYKKAITEAGIELDDDIIAHGDDHFESGFQATRHLLSMESAPTAIFCNNDEMAAGSISAVFEAGLKVPQNVSVAGFDDILLASQIWPPLTTVQQPIYQIAEIATNLLIRLLKGEDTPDLKYEVETALVIRKSTAAIKEHHQEKKHE
jgi:LacI family transcriptional regulator